MTSLTSMAQYGIIKIEVRELKDDKYLELRRKTVTKANDLIQKSRFNLSLQQQKIVLYLISQITSTDEDFKLYEFSIAEFCRVCGIDDNNGKTYQDLKTGIKEIADKSLWVAIDERRETLLRWIEKPYIDAGSGVIRIRLDSDMKPFLLQLKQNFTSYEILWTLHFKSKYTVRLYELVKSIHFHDLDYFQKRYSVDELKRLLGGDRYKQYRDFKRRVLVPSVKEINQYSDKSVVFEEIKRGRKVMGIEFNVTSKDSMEAAKIRSDIEKEMGFDQLTLWDKLEDKGFA